MHYSARWQAKVRDYECDIQGIVNNSVYQNYLEHARHEFLLEIGISFAELAQAGIHLVVVRAEIDYKSPLKSGDSFWVGSNVKRISKLRFAFSQDIYRVSDQKCVASGHVFGASLNKRGRPSVFSDLDAAIDRLNQDPV